MTISEFTAVVLAGGEGAPLYPLVERKPKCLLPVGNVPIMFYTLKYIQEEGFESVYVITKNEWKLLIETELRRLNGRQDRKLKLFIKIIILTYETDHLRGSGAVLSVIKNNIEPTLNVIIFGGDMIGTLDPFHELMTLHRKSYAAVTIFAAKAVRTEEKIFNKKTKLNHTVKKYLNSRDFIGLDTDGERLLYFMNDNEIEDRVHVNPLALFRHSSMKMCTDLHDLHIYTFRFDIIDELLRNVTDDVSVQSLRVDIIPKLIESQFRQYKEELVPREITNISENQDWSVDMLHDMTMDEVVGQFNIGRDSSVGSYNGLSTPSSFMDFKDRKCCIYINKSSSPVYRVNTMTAYTKALTEIHDKQTIYLFSSIRPETKQKKQKERFLKTLLERTSKVSDDCNIRYSNIFSNCLINEQSKLMKVTLFENVEIGKNCRIDNCIVANDAKIHDNCVLSNCIIGPGEIVFENTNIKEQTVYGSVDLFNGSSDY